MEKTACTKCYWGCAASGSRARMVGVENGAAVLKTAQQFPNTLSTCLLYMIPPFHSWCLPRRDEGRCPCRDHAEGTQPEHGRVRPVGFTCVKWHKADLWLLGVGAVTEGHRRQGVAMLVVFREVWFQRCVNVSECIKLSVLLCYFQKIFFKLKELLAYELMSCPASVWWVPGWLPWRPLLCVFPPL